MHYVGAIDQPDQNRISGWAVTQFGDVCTVTATVNAARRFTVESDEPRPDLASKQQSRGAGGFRIDVASALVAGTNHIELTFPDGKHLPGSPITRVLPADWVAPPPPPPATRRAPPALKLAPAVPHLTAAELEDISLDDVCHAVAHQMIDVPTPPLRAPSAPEAQAAAPVVLAEATASAPAPRTSVLARVGRMLRRKAV